MSWFTNPQQAVTEVAENVTSSVTNAGGSFLSNLISAPFRAISGFGSGVMGSLWNGVKYTGILLGVQALAPTLFNPAYGAIFGQEALQKLKDRREKNGLPGMLVDSAELGFGSAAALGGATGAIQNAGLVGGGLVMATVAAVTIGALHKNNVNVADADGHAGTPPATPGSKPKAEQAKS